jgi:ribonuclease III family protein
MEKSIEMNTIGKNETFFDKIKIEFSLTKVDAKQYSPLTLAYIGDGIYDLIIRTLIVEQGNAPVNKIHKKVTSMVKAQAQAEIITYILKDLTQEEVVMYKRGRNAKSFTSAKNASIAEYRMATGFEALMGYLYLTNQMPRALVLIKLGLEIMNIPTK